MRRWQDEAPSLQKLPSWWWHFPVASRTALTASENPEPGGPRAKIQRGSVHGGHSRQSLPTLFIFVATVCSVYFFILFLQQNGVSSALQPPIFTSKERHSTSQRPSIFSQRICLWIPPLAEWRKQVVFSYPAINCQKTKSYHPDQMHNPPVMNLLEAEYKSQRSRRHLSSCALTWCSLRKTKQQRKGVPFLTIISNTKEIECSFLGGK